MKQKSILILGDSSLPRKELFDKLERVIDNLIGQKNVRFFYNSGHGPFTILANYFISDIGKRSYEDIENTFILFERNPSNTMITKSSNEMTPVGIVEKAMFGVQETPPPYYNTVFYLTEKRATFEESIEKWGGVLSEIVDFCLVGDELSEFEKKLSEKLKDRGVTFFTIDDFE